jgi:PAS domain S-box-containing protein
MSSNRLYIPQRWAHTWERLTAPSTAIVDADVQQRARLLAGLHVFLIPVTLVIAVVWLMVDPTIGFTLPVSVSVLAFMLAVYGLSRTRYFQLASIVMIGSVIFVVILNLIINPHPFADRVSSLDYLTVAVLLASLFLSIRSAVFVALIGVAMTLIALFITPDFSLSIVYRHLGFVVLMSGLLLFSAFLRQRELTSRRQIETSLRESEQRYRETFEQASVGISHTTPSGNWLQVNQTVCDILGYTREELVARKWQDITHPDDLPADLAQSQRLLAGEINNFSMEKRYLRKDGSHVWVNMTLSLVRHPSGDPNYFIAVVRDITERKEAEEALRVSEMRYRIISELISDYAYSLRVEPDGELEHEWITEDSFTRRTGYTHDEVDAQGKFALFHPEDADKVNAALDDLLAGKPGSGDYRIITKSGELRWLHIHRRPVWDEEQQWVIRLYGVAQDITERKQAEAALAAERNLLRILIDNLPDYIYTKDRQSKYVLFNEATMRLLGVSTPQEYVGKGDFDYYPQEFAERYYADEQAMMADNHALINREEPVIDRDGNVSWLLTTKAPLLDDQGQVIGIVGVGRDITERKQAEEALQQASLRLEASRDTLRRLIQQLPIGIQVFDADGVCTDVNETHMGIFGVVNREQLVGTYNIFNDPLAALVGTLEGAKRALAGETMFLGDLKFDLSQADPRYAATSGQRTINVSFFPVFDEARKITNIVGLNQDVTERRRAEGQRLELAVEQERVELLQHFIRDTSHDFRTPLTTIKTSLYLLAKTIDEEEKRGRYMEVIDEQTTHLQKLLDDLLNMSRLDKTANADFIFEPRVLNLLLQNVVAAHKSLAERKSHSVSLEVEADLPAVLIDDTQLGFALSNILLNALNYTPAGGQIAVRAFRKEQQVMIAVKDNGIGISQEDLPHIFDRFFRADKARGVGTGGTGLGLTIARRIVQAHGGDIEVESEPDKGSVFYVWLPLVSMPE